MIGWLVWMGIRMRKPLELMAWLHGGLSSPTLIVRRPYVVLHVRHSCQDCIPRATESTVNPRNNSAKTESFLWDTCCPNILLGTVIEPLVWGRSLTESL